MQTDFGSAWATVGGCRSRPRFTFWPPLLTGALRFPGLPSTPRQIYDTLRSTVVAVPRANADTPTGCGRRPRDIAAVSVLRSLWRTAT